ncbi:ExeM/NucH family extracellular endonuclease [Corynebacterium auris]|uniref:ExeM/NucH family extracellular endonuclease n=1 Tax=Corynebacterium auris TaxID=44750 RepID=UPI0025B41058|nr:ExeM/NucH family extracellular endonuclease [Corynebacterium auris]WJY68736.1 Endonuclease/Exonuclease/phosphatase family protein [Corynebacterium auris]
MPRTCRAAWSAVLSFALAAGAAVASPSPARAAADGSTVVISEVYGGGGNSGSVFSHDFVELYNPTASDIDITGWRLEQRSAKDGLGATVTLSGIVPADSHFLIRGSAGRNPSGQLPAADIEASFNFSATEAIAELYDATSARVDLLGWGAAARYEGSPAPATNNSTSVQRADSARDTDNNAADFLAAAPTPSAAPADAGAAPGITPIREIQGTGDSSPLLNHTVTTEGVVTAVYDEGGKNGFFLQAAGSGTQAGEASEAVFVYMGRRTDYPRRGASVRVTGTVGEYYAQTQIAASAVEALPAALEAPVALEIESLPAGDAAREPYEGMLVRPTGAHTVTDNYTLNTTGDVGLAPGPRAHRTPTDVVEPGAQAQSLAVANDAEVVYLDDGRTRDYFRTDKETPLPYLVTADGGVTSLRTGDAVRFQNDVVVDYSFDRWRFQPLQPITGKSEAADLPIAWADSRGATLDVPGSVAGELSLGFFNVLNYFTSLGEDEEGCEPFTDKNGAPVGANSCRVRGAYSRQAFEDQQAKLVTAINRLDTDVLGLSEIENTAALTKDASRRDEALRALVGALNDAAGHERWAYAPSPASLPGSEDVIRVAFLYDPATVRPVGESRIFDDGAFTGTARQPLAQAFEPAAGGQRFVAVVNHFKSKGSVAHNDSDTGDGQGNNANVREAQSKALLEHLGEQSDWAQLPTFLIGDFNAYTREDAITELARGGFEVIRPERDSDQASYQFGGELGSLDHVLANGAARALVRDAAVWNINADEPVAFEYSRRNYNAQDFFGDGADPLYGYGNPFRSSDHDPVKVGFDLDGPREQGSSAARVGIAAALVAAAVGALALLWRALPWLSSSSRGR